MATHITSRVITTPIKDNQPKKQLHYLGGKVVEAKSSSGIRRWRWEIWRRGTKSTKSAKVDVKRKKYKSKKWSKRSKRKDHILQVVTIQALGKTTIFRLIDRGPKYVTQDRNVRYRLKEGNKPSVGYDTVAKAEKRIASEIKRLRGLKVKEPRYVVITPAERSARARQKAGFRTLADAKSSMNKGVAEKQQWLKEANITISKMLAEQKRPDPELRQWNRLSKKFIRTKKVVVNSAKLRVEVLGFTKRVDAEARKPMELLAVRQVKWTMMVGGRKRTQTVAFQLTRWGFGISTRPAWLPSYTVTDFEGKDFHFINRQADKQDEITMESFEKVFKVGKPLKRARAELERLTSNFVKGLQRTTTMDDYPERSINRGVGTETIGNKRVKVIKYGLSRGYPKIGTAFFGQDIVNLVGGVVLQIYNKGSKKPSREIEWQIVKRKRGSKRKGEGGVLLIRHNGSKIGSYTTVERARNALRRLVNDTIYSLR